MTKQDNIDICRPTAIKSNTLVGSLMVIGVLIVMLTFGSESKLNAQVNEEHVNFANMTSTLKKLHQNVMANGTVNLEQIVFNAIRSKINISLAQAMTTAQQSVGNNSFAVAAFGGQYGEYFAYQILLGTPEMKFYNVLVDPGNGQILATQKVSVAGLVKMHKEHSAEVVRNSSDNVIGFPFLIPH